MYRCKCCGKPCDSTLCKSCYKPFDVNDEEVSFAFTEEIPTNEKLENYKIIDLFNTQIEKIDFTGFKKLEKLRISHCFKLKEVNLKNIPTLKVVDLSGSYYVSVLDLTGSPNIVTLDISICPYIKRIYGSLQNCEYFAAPQTNITQIPSLPNVKYLNLRASGISSTDDLRCCTKLQWLDISELPRIESFDIGGMPELTDLVYLKCSCNDLYMKGIPKTSKLATIICKAVHDIPDYLSCSICCNQGVLGNKFAFPVNSGDWHDAHRLIYGPWPSPPNDFEPRVKCECVYPLPDGADKQRAADCIAGVLFGTAIGDCVGLHTERDPIPYIQSVLDNPLDITWDHPHMTKRGLAFHRGSFTDDTALSLMFIRGVCDGKGEIDPVRFGKWIHTWIDDGLCEHNDGFGIGQGPSTAQAVHAPSYDLDPLKVSMEVWDQSGRFSAGNGAVMRTGSVGCYKFWDDKFVVENARIFAAVTHPHPLCIYGSIVISLLIARFIQMRCGLRDDVDIDATIEECFAYVPELTEKDIQSLRPFLYARELIDLQLDTPYIPPTLGTMGCGIWCLRKNLTYAQGIEAIIRAGGDTDTNGAVAGACLGAKLGFSAIPKDLIMFLWYRFSVRRDLIPFLSLMGLEFDPNSEFHYPLGEDMTMKIKPKQLF